MLPQPEQTGVSWKIETCSKFTSSCNKWVQGTVLDGGEMELMKADMVPALTKLPV